MQAITFVLHRDSLSLQGAQSSKDFPFNPVSLYRVASHIQQENKLERNTPMPHPDNLPIEMKSGDTD